MRTTLTIMLNMLKPYKKNKVINIRSNFTLGCFLLINTLSVTTLSRAFAFEIKVDKTVQTMAYSKLGDFQLDTATINSVSSISGHNLLASVSEKVGSNFSMFLPFGVQQINYIVDNGSYIEENQAISYLNGFDVHHFLDEYAAAKQLFLNAKQQYKSSKSLFARKALKQSQWLEVSKSYFEAQLRFEHLNHYKAFLIIDSNENIAIKSPVSGYVRFTSDVAVKEEGELLFDVVPKDSIRLKISAPINNIANLTYIKVLGTQCQLPIVSKGGVVKNFSQTIWSSKLSETCQFSLGEQLLVIPQYDQQAFELPKTAVFEFNNQNYIAIKNDESSQFQLIAIEIMSSSVNSYFVSSYIDLTSKQALITSISVLQGVLLELGEE